MDTWTQHMRRGDFAAAWEESDAVLRARAGTPCWHLPRHEQYLWDGTPLDGQQRVLIRCYHGLGDTVQFIRYAPWVRARAREVVVWAQGSLVELLRGVAGIDRILPLHDGSPGVDCDLDVEIMELPHLFRSTVQTLPARVPYIHLPTGPLPPVLPAEPPPFRVGLVWRSGDWDERRSVPLPALVAALTGVVGVELHSLQLGGAAAEWRAEFGPVSGSADVLTLARTMRSLDLIVSVDSFPAHLAGALGCPVWTLLHAEPDWRWLDGREDSPWYPTMRLFRQEAAGDWQLVLSRVAAELRRCVETPSTSASAI